MIEVNFVIQKHRAFSARGVKEIVTAEAWEPIDFLAEFRERETCLREVTELLKEEAQCETGKLWAME